MAVEPEAVWLIGGETGDELKERDSSSWKYRVGSVEPLMRLMAIEPSILLKYVMNQFSQKLLMMIVGNWKERLTPTC